MLLLIKRALLYSGQCFQHGAYQAFKLARDNGMVSTEGLKLFQYLHYPNPCFGGLAPILLQWPPMRRDKRYAIHGNADYRPSPAMDLLFSYSPPRWQAREVLNVFDNYAVLEELCRDEDRQRTLVKQKKRRRENENMDVAPPPGVEELPDTSSPTPHHEIIRNEAFEKLDEVLRPLLEDDFEFFQSLFAELKEREGKQIRWSQVKGSKQLTNEQARDYWRKTLGPKIIKLIMEGFSRADEDYLRSFFRVKRRKR